MTADTRTLVNQLLRRIGEGDPERIAELYAEHADWKLSRPESRHGRDILPWIRPRSSRADVADHFRSLAEEHAPERADTRTERTLVDGNDAVVLGEIRQTARGTDSYRARFAPHPTVAHGLITRHRVCEDSLAVLDAFDAGVAP
ncbi:nuclear transport factor 2 family protein [Streptomyces reniochalinae]|uniref:Ketosteroid isomerase n=1 Tax=Streptomyces reniochalinae TaxID=2250578 RepID=A0A367EHT6_9ACTN|nr:nuclear transport factor 2 family protein [Streptomyces reniochalinae]RCG17601.1 ketosteroid isomerase [Streptomyces reniochalinae]